MTSLINYIQDHATIIIAVLAIFEGCLCAFLIRRNEDLRVRLYRAREAAEDAARAAALASPGGIDPEVVIHLLRSGQTPTLDSVHAFMEQNEKSSG